MDIRLIEFYKNLKNWDFDISSVYKVDINEADKIIKAIESMQKSEAKNE